MQNYYKATVKVIPESPRSRSEAPMFMYASRSHYYYNFSW